MNSFNIENIEIELNTNYSTNIHGDNTYWIADCSITLNTIENVNSKSQILGDILYVIACSPLFKKNFDLNGTEYDNDDLVKAIILDEFNADKIKEVVREKFNTVNSSLNKSNFNEVLSQYFSIGN